MADTPETGTGLSENDSAEALAKLRQAPQKDKPAAENSDEAQPEEEAEETQRAEPERGDGKPPAEQTSDEAETQDDSSESDDAAEVEITLPSGERIRADEAARGYLRQSDYTKKTQELAETRKALEKREQEVLPKLQQLVATLESQADKAPDWVKLASELDPWEFNKRKVEYDAKDAARQAARAQLEAAQRQHLIDAQAQAKKTLMTDGFEKSWSTEEGLKKGIEQIAAFAVEFGFDPQVLSNITDPKVIKIMELARQRVELQKAGTKAQTVIKTKPKPLKPGAKHQQTTAGRELQQSKNRFHQTKTMADAISVLGKIRAA